MTTRPDFEVPGRSAFLTVVWGMALRTQPSLRTYLHHGTTLPALTQGSDTQGMCSLQRSGGGEKAQSNVIFLVSLVSVVSE